MPDMHRTSLDDAQHEVVTAVLGVTVLTNEFGRPSADSMNFDPAEGKAGDIHARLPAAAVVNDIHGHDPAREVFARRGKPFAFRQHLRRKVLQKRGLGQVGTPFRMSDAYKIAQSGMVCNAQSTKSHV